MRIRNRIPFLAVLLAALALAGCVPTRYAWSPDGQWMTVLTDSGLRICDARGILTSAKIPDVDVASWFPDSQHLLVSREIHITKWNDLTPYLTPEQAQLLAEVGERACQSLLDYDFTAPNAAQWDHFEAWFAQQEQQAKRDTTPYKNLVGDIGIYMRNYITDAERQKLPPAMAQQLDQLTQSVYVAQVYTISPTGASPGPILMKLLKAPNELRVAPNSATAIICVGSVIDGQACDTYVVTIDASHAPVLVASNTSWYPDWTADGKSIVYVVKAAASPSGVGLGTLTLARVIGDDGKLLEAPRTPTDLAGLIYDDLDRVRSLPDGRVIFSCIEVTLPSAPNDMPQHPQLFAVTPGKQATITRLLPRGVLDRVGDAAQYFEPSPSGARVAIPSTNGTVTVVDLASGDPIDVQSTPFPGKDQNDKLTLPTVPNWRSDNELTFMTPDPNKIGNVVLWSLSSKSGKTLSTDWPAGTIPRKN